MDYTSWMIRLQMTGGAGWPLLWVASFVPAVWTYCMYVVAKGAMRQTWLMPEVYGQLRRIGFELRRAPTGLLLMLVVDAGRRCGTPPPPAAGWAMVDGAPTQRTLTRNDTLWEQRRCGEAAAGLLLQLPGEAAEELRKPAGPSDAGQ
jgi:hypothetical protein